MYSLLQNTIRSYKILSFGVIPQKSEFFVKNGLNKLFYVLKVYLYIKIYIEFKIIFIARFYGSSCAVFVWGENLEHVNTLGFFSNKGWLS